MLARKKFKHYYDESSGINFKKSAHDQEFSFEIVCLLPRDHSTTSNKYVRNAFNNQPNRFLDSDFNQ